MTTEYLFLLLLLNQVFLSGVLGASLVSLINVGIDGENSFFKNLSKPKSTCENCGKKLTWWELIPVFGWLLLRGRCSKCKERIPIYHFLSELVVFIIFGVGFYFISGRSINSNFYSLLSFWVLVIVMYFFSAFDIKRGIIPNKFIFPIIGIVFFGRVGQFLFGYTNVRQLFSCLLGGLIYFAIFGLINLLTTKGLFPGVKKGRRGFGWGDAKYGLFLGLILGVRQTLLSFWIAVFVGAVYGVIIKISSKGKTNKIPFAPFMSIGVLVSFIVGSYLLQYFIDNILMLSL